MRLTFIITIDPVKGLSLLNVLLHSLNLQTHTNFAVVFYNQTQFNEKDLFAQLQVQPEFEYQFFSVEHFLGNFPLWDLYTFHRQLLEVDLLGDYFMSLHMEEFFDIDYVENVTNVLEATGFDILFGNLCRTSIDGTQIADLLTTRTAHDFGAYLYTHGLKRAPHWTFKSLPKPLLATPSVLKSHLQKFISFGFRTRLAPSRLGYASLSSYYEDLYFMRTEFARRYNWFLPGRRMYFEDVQLCDIPGVCELGRELGKLTAFPRYFNRGKIYHLNHPKFYYQLQDPGFTEALLVLQTDDLLLQTLQQAIRMYRARSVTLKEALRYTRRNAAGTGTQNLNYQYHMQVLEAARTSTPGVACMRAGPQR